MAIACITGAAGGLGKAFAQECAKHGYDLFLTDTSEEALRVLAKGLERSYGAKAETFACNLTDANEREALYAQLRRFRGRIGLLVNVAGTDIEGRFGALTPAQIRLIIRLNMESMLELTHEMLPLRRLGAPSAMHKSSCGSSEVMRDSERQRMGPASCWFRIINVGSLAAFQPMPYKALYAASKRFILNWSLALGEELRAENVTVTTLCPAGMPTTREAIEGIRAQGVLGSITTRDVPFVAALTFRRAHRGARLVIPGGINRFTAWLSTALPKAFVARAIARRWRRTYGAATSRENLKISPKMSYNEG